MSTPRNPESPQRKNAPSEQSSPLGQTPAPQQDVEAPESINSLHDQRPGAVEPQPDTLQPDVQSLPDMEATQSDRFRDAQAEQVDDAERAAIIDEKIERGG